MTTLALHGSHEVISDLKGRMPLKIMISMSYDNQGISIINPVTDSYQWYLQLVVSWPGTLKFYFSNTVNNMDFFSAEPSG